MPDVAELGLKVTSDDVETASQRLDKLTTASANAQAMVEKLTDKIRDIASAYISFDFLQKTIEQFVNQTIEAQNAITQMNAHIQATGDVSQETVKSLTVLAQQMADIGTNSATANENAEDVLLTFQHIGKDVFPDALKVINDISSALGTDLTSAAKVVGKALNDPINGINALNREGITFDDSLKAQIKTMIQHGDTVGAQTLVLNNLSKSFNGSAAAARDTLGGALKVLQNNFNDLFVVTGPQATSLTTSIQELAEAFTDPKVKEAVVGFGKVLFDLMTGLVNLIVSAWSEFKQFLQWLQTQADSQNSIPTMTKQLTDAQAALAAAQNFKAGNDQKNAGDIAQFGIPDYLAQMSNTFSGVDKEIQMRTAEIAELQTKIAEAQGKLAGGNQYGVQLDPSEFTNAPLSALTPSKPNNIGLTQDQLDKLAQQKAAYDKIITSGNQVAASYKLQEDALGKTAEEADYMKNKQDMLNAAQSANIPLTTKQTQVIDQLAQKQAKANEALTGAQLNYADRSPFTQIADQVKALNQQLDDGAISWQTYNVEVNKVATNLSDSFATAAGNVLDSLDSITSSMGSQGQAAFEIHKALSLARAVVSGQEAIVNSYSAGTSIGGPVVGAIFAGIAAAAVAAQIAAIASTTYSSTTTSNVMSSSATASASSATTAPTQGVTIVFKSNGAPVPADDVEDMLNRFADALGDGAAPRFIKVVRQAA